MSISRVFGGTLLLASLVLSACALPGESGANAEATPEALAAVQAGQCTPDCSGRTCGLDPICGVSCGSCATGQLCDDATGQCQTACVPDCSGRLCGLDPVCGTSCGSCSSGESCNETAGTCEPKACVPDCRGRTCGLDPVCGTSCGSCKSGSSCDANAGLCELDPPTPHHCSRPRRRFRRFW